MLNHETMTDTELLRATTISKDNYSAVALAALAGEMARRGLDANQLLSRVQLAGDEGETQACTIAAALAKITAETVLWKPLMFTNAVGEQLILQRQLSFWNADFLDQEDYQHSFLLQDVEQARELFRAFAQLATAAVAVLAEFHLDEWETVLQSNSHVRLENVSRALTAAAVAHVVKPGEGASFYLLVPAQAFAPACAVVEGLDQRRAALEAAIDKLPPRGREEQRLELYEQLLPLTEERAVLQFNRGVLLFELGRSEAAAAAFGEAVGADLAVLQEQGCLEDLENCLESLWPRLPANVEILHSLAVVKVFKQCDEEAAMLYDRILARCPEDAIAHLNLGYLLHAEPAQSHRALAHFKRYLELVPQAEDRTLIERLVAELNRE